VERSAVFVSNHLFSPGDFRFKFAYPGSMSRWSQPITASMLRSEISHRNAGRAAEMTYSSIPSVVYDETENGGHGNFLLASYRRILRREGWRARLAKVYTGSRFLAHQEDRTRRELECANSSDALLMKILCYPGMLRRKAVCSLLGIELGVDPAFGFRPQIPLANGACDRSELDLRLGNLFVEAKLTEGDFQTARCDLVHRYRDLESVFTADRLPKHNGGFRSCQLIRGALAAHAHGVSFAVFCDQRRQDLIEDCFLVMSAVSSADLRCRLSVVTWQEIATAAPAKVRTFVSEKYGIV
jgi:hypothetical protein